VIAILLIIGGSPTWADDDYQPLKIPAESILNRVKVIAMEPFTVPVDVVLSGELRIKLEQILLEELENRGYQVLPSIEFDSRWQRYSEQIGGVYDPQTGIRDEEKYGIVWDFTTRELQNRFHAQAVADPNIFYRELTLYPRFGDLVNIIWKIAGNTAVQWSGSPLTERPSYVNGAWVGMGIYDAERAKLYSVGVPLGYVAVYALRGRELLPAERLLDPLDHYREVVAVVVKDLPQHSIAQSPQ
jgi:hypothetical protein